MARMANRFKAKVVFAHMYLQADQQCITLEPLKEPLTGDIAKDHQAIFGSDGGFGVNQSRSLYVMDEQNVI